MKEVLILSLTKDTEEIVNLTRSLGYRVVKIFVQRRTNPDVNYWIGWGKLLEIKDFLAQTPPPSASNGKLVVVNGRLRPSQQFKLEKALKTDVYDRLRLILEIFADRAKSKEAKLQVELAKLSYEVPHIRELIHRAKIGEHPGYMAGGAYKVEDYFELIRKQIKGIKKQLEHSRLQREVRRGSRRRKGFYLVSIAGYTNAGKSTLLNRLSGAEVRVNNRMFTTLSTKTQKMKLNERVLLTDTVGFISGIPNWLVDAFRSTFEEIEFADCIILLVDMSESSGKICRKTEVALSQLMQWGVKSLIILAFNKIDLVEREDLVIKKQELLRNNTLASFNMVEISAEKEIGIERLIGLISQGLPGLLSLKISIPPYYTNEIFSWLKGKANIKNVKYKELTEIDVECSMAVKKKLESFKGCKLIELT